MNNTLSDYMTTGEAAGILGIDPKSTAHLVRKGRILGIKIANRWLVDRSFIEEFAKTYEAKRGRPTGWRKHKDVDK